MPEIDFNKLTRQLVRAAGKDFTDGIALFEKKLPAVTRQIQTDARRNGPLSFWGRSRNFDELANKTIVDPAILRMIGHFANRSLSDSTPHAGLQHTYGYLLSNIETAYGFKRDRWTETGIESAFGFDPSTLGPDPSQGTLLSNATYFAGSIAFRGGKQLARLKSNLQKKVADDLKPFRPQAFTHTRISERVKNKYRGIQRIWTLQTDLLQAKPNSILVYSVVDQAKKQHQLITLFPVEDSTVADLRQRARTKTREDIRARFNAWIPALGDREFRGGIQLREF